MGRDLTKLQSYINEVPAGIVRGLSPILLNGGHPTIFCMKETVRIWAGSIPAVDVYFTLENRGSVPLLSADPADWSASEMAHAQSYISEYGIKLKKDNIFEPMTRTNNWIYFCAEKDNKSALIGGFN